MTILGLLVAASLLAAPAACGDDEVQPDDGTEDDGGTQDDGTEDDGADDGGDGAIDENCSADGWCIEAPFPVATAWFNAAWASGPDDVWMVGAGGAVARRDGGGWRRVVIGTADELFGISGTGPDDVWVHGERELFHWDGDAWSQVEVDCGCGDLVGPTLLTGIAARAPDDVWLSGEGDGLEPSQPMTCRWNGTEWSQVLTGGGEPKECGPSLGFCSPRGPRVGLDGDIWCGLSRWDGEQLVPVEEGVGDVGSVLAVDQDDVWASQYPDLLHWDGVELTRLQLPEVVDLGATELAGTSSDDVWLLGEDGALHWDGSAWSAQDLGVTEPRAQAIAATGPGLAYVGGFDGLLLRGEAGTWQEESERFPGEGHRPLWGATATDIWLGFVRWDGEAWTAADVGDRSMHEIAGFAADDVYAVSLSLEGGQGTELAHFDGEAWSFTPAAELGVPGGVADAELVLVGGSSAEDLWIGGHDGAEPNEGGFVARRDGDAWVRVDTPEPPSEMWAAADDDVWIAFSRFRPPEAYDWFLAHWDGTEWQEHAAPKRAVLRDLHAVASDDVWACGDGGLLMHWDGSAWAEHPSGVDADLFAFSARGSDALWVAGMGPGGAGQVLALDGGEWRAESLPTRGATHILAIDGEVWASGDYVVRKRP